MAVVEAAQCRCGSPMVPSGSGSTCPNCDIPQPQEFLAARRVKTREDVQFDRAWERRMNEIYGDDNGETKNAN